MEVNQIRNSELKENLVNTAINILVQNNLVTKDDFPGLTVNVGYLFTKDNGQFESLFRLDFTGKTFYFALQEGKLMIIDIDDNMFNGTVEQMKSFHPCLLSDELPETEAQKNRRIRNNDYIKSLSIAYPDKLMTRWDDDQTEIKEKTEICTRALAAFFVIQIACDIGAGNYDESIEFFKPIIEEMGLTEHLNSKEKRIFDGTYDMQDAIDMDWAYEAYWSLCWALGLVDDIRDAGEVCDCDAAIDFVRGCKTIDEFVSKCTLRDKSEILDMLDLYYRYNWAVNESRVNPETETGDLNPSIVIERRRGLEWLVSDVSDWYDLDMPA
ncbi:MAG: DUF4272 domain-containing protein [Lachnospiraceae bacterium]|nr:DUF4272 domain-containing protein [Lachnospiraceae bacterium]